MSFLTPFFLLGGLALAAPVIFHLIRRTTRERTTFSSLMFLSPSAPRLSRRSRLEHWLLLILRCLALALLAIGFARPFLKQAPLIDPSGAQPKRTVVLVDVSASMRRTGVWSDARDRVSALVRAAAPADRLAVMTFDRRVVPLISFEDWDRAAPGDRAGLVSSRLATVSPSWAGTHLGSALITAAESLAETDGKTAPVGPREVVLVSDVQAGSRLDTLQAYEWPKGVALRVEQVKAHRVTNAGIQLVAESTDAPTAAGAVMRVRVTNAADSQREQFKVGWLRAADAAQTGASAANTADFAGAPVDVYVPPGQSRVVAVPVPKSGTGVPPVSAAEHGQDARATFNRLALRGDDEDFDNTIFAIPPAQQKLSVLWLGADAPDDTKQPLFFLRRALTDSPRLAVKVIAHAPSTPLLPAEVADAAVIFVSDALPPAEAEALRARALAGQTIVFTPKSAAAAPTLAALLGTGAIAMEESKPANYAMLAEIDFRHPLFAPFADPRFSDFTKIHVWKYRKIAADAIPGARAVVKFDNGDPALLDVPVGRGRIFVLAAGWQPDDSQLAVSSKFVPLIFSLLELAGGVAEAPAPWVVGDAVPVPVGGGDPIAIRTPAGKTITLAAGANQFSDTDEPGLYEFAMGGRTQRFAVNLDANESRTAPLGADELEHLGVPVTLPQKAAAPTPEDTKVLVAAEAENRQKLWRWFVAATLAVLLLETALAGRTARRLTLKPEETPT